MFNYQENFMNAVDLAALVIGIVNLQENRQQSAYNDVHAANDEQAKILLDELGKKFDEQNKTLSQIVSLLEKRENSNKNANQNANYFSAR